MWWITAALALPPNGNTGRITVGSGAISAMAVSTDDAIVAGRDADGRLWVLDVDGWVRYQADPGCGVTGVAVVPSRLEGDGAYDLFLSCSDGSVHWYIYEDGVLGPVLDSSTSEAISIGITVDGDPFEGIWWNQDTSGDPLLYMIENVGVESYMHVWSPYTGLVNGEVSSVYTNNPYINSGGFVEGVIDFGNLYIAHPNGRSTILNLSTGVVTAGALSTSLYTINDITPGNGTLWGVDTDGGYLFQYNAQQATFTNIIDGFVNPRAVAASLVPGDEWIMVSGDGIWIYEMENGFILDPTTPVYVNQSAEIQIQDAIVGGEYTFGGGSGGNVQVITDRPWVDASTEATEPILGETFDVTFSVDEDASYVVTRGGDRYGSGATVASGEAVEDELVTVPVTVEDGWDEGENRIYVVATNPNGRTGHGRVSVSVDARPDPPEAVVVTFADGALSVRFDGIDDRDLDTYTIYVSDEPFEASDYPTGGPDRSADGLPGPTVVEAEPSMSVDVRIEPLANGTTYYIGVRATDEGGQESMMSEVVAGVPAEEFTASELAGETGGGPCSTGPAPGALGFLFAGCALALRRRRMLAGAAVLACLSVPAHAGKDNGDLSPQRGDFELRYGGFLNLEDDSIKSVYGTGGHNMLQMEFGPQLWRFFEIDLEVGFYQELANTVSEATDGSTSPSSTRTMLTWFPLGLSGTARLQIFDEQLIVPHARLGMDYVPWTELTDNGTGGKNKVSGSKLGHHYAIGASLLLDIFAPARASLLEAQTGINDTYVTVEWRRQNIDSRNTPWAAAEVDGFDFSGSMLTVGLKLDY